MVVAGPAIYLLGHVLFRLRMAGTLSRKRLAGALACVAVGGLGAGRAGSRALRAARRRARGRDRRGADRRSAQTRARRAVAERTAGIRRRAAASLPGEGGVVEARTARPRSRSLRSPRDHWHQRAAGHVLPGWLVLRHPLQLQPSQQRRPDRPPGIARPLAQPHVHRQHVRARVLDARLPAGRRDDVRAARRRVDVLDPDALRRHRADHPAGGDRLLHQAHVPARRVAARRPEDGDRQRGGEEGAVEDRRRLELRRDRRQAPLLRAAAVQGRPGARAADPLPQLLERQDARQPEPQAAHGLLGQRRLPAEPSHARCRRSR